MTIFVLSCSVIVVIWGLMRLHKEIIFDYERGIVFIKGKFTKILEPGQHWLWGSKISIKKMDIRSRFITIPGQELLTADCISIKLSMAAHFEVLDPKTAYLGQENYEQTLYLTVQLAVREIVSVMTVDELFAKRNEIGKKLFDMCSSKAEAMGLKVHSVDLKDISFPGELKKVFAQVVAAQKEGLAALEKARGETAALRHLANAAKMLEDNPALMQLRLLQSSGHTIVLGANGSIIPIKEKKSQS